MKCASEFIEDFCNKIQSLLPHNFIAKSQSAYLRYLKESLQEDEVIVICDFAENYSFIVQEAAPGFHWNNDQATIYTVVIYYRIDSQLTHTSLVIISDCLNHDAIAVKVYSDIIIDEIKTLLTNVAKIHYFTDGAPQQYKNYKHFSNVYHHEEDYGIKAEWNFFATAHGKGPCDGLGGTVKRMAARASLQLPYDRQILTPQDLYKWALENLPNINIKFSSQLNYETIKDKLASRFANAMTVPGTQQLHQIIPHVDYTVKVKKYSQSEEFSNHSIVKRRTSNEPPRKRRRKND